MYYNLDMENYPPMKRRTVCFAVVVFCVFIAITFSACGTKTAVVSGTDNDGKPAVDTGVPKNQKSTPLIEMVAVSGGTFRMGNPGNPSRRDSSTLDLEWPRHEVTLRDFYIGKYEVTQGQYLEVTGMKPSSHFKNPDDDSADGWMKLPVESISWYDAVIFCNMLSVKEKLKPVYSLNGSVNPDDWGEPPSRRSLEWETMTMDVKANGYRLPTEAEWEYAARGGAASKGYQYAGSDVAAQVAWYTLPYSRAVVTIHEVGKKQPNEIGLYDMSGNVMEWCWDWLDTYPADPQDNPIGPSKGLYRVIRGGGWSIRPDFSRILFRHNNQAHYFGINLGFRVARNR
jgi:formylglycine-generating enzyme required for sulfatase activity